MSRAIRLHEKHTQRELAQMAQDVLADPSNKAEKGSLYKLTPKARKLHDDICWAIYWHQAPKGNTGMQSVAPQGRWW